MRKTNESENPMLLSFGWIDNPYVPDGKYNTASSPVEEA